jgi:ribosome-associated toxin RatA of RatAB toxin-antitoxin module
VKPAPEHRAEHAITVAAPPEVVYGLVRDVTRWPVIFRPTIHVERSADGQDGERLRIWAIANDEVTSWESRRSFDRAALRIGFVQEKSSPPVGSMRGEWAFRPLRDGRTEVVLSHWFTPADGSADAVDWIRQALDRNSASELAGLRDTAELDPPLREVLISFDDTVEVAGLAADAYRFVYEAQHWPARLPHVARVELAERNPGIQRLAMDSVAADGATHRTNSLRVCFEDRLVAYKQTIVPRLLLGHSGHWKFAATATGSRVTAGHTVAIDPAMIHGVLGTSATLADAKAFAVNAIGANSRATLEHARDFAEAAKEGT